jgi:putative spermidine/putrescine transport system permease protein
MKNSTTDKRNSKMGLTGNVGTKAVAGQNRQGRRLRAALIGPPLVFVLVLLVYPALELLWRSVTDPTPGFGNYTRIVTGPVVGTVIYRTVVMAAIVTVASVLLAYPYAYLMTLVGSRWRAILTAVVLIPLWTSLMARTFAWIVLLQKDGPVSNIFELFGFGPVTLLGTTPGVVIAMAQVMLPFVVMPMFTNMRTIDGRLMDAARSMGAKPLTVFSKIYLPLSFPGVASGATLVLVLSLGFYVTPALIGTPKNSMFGQYIAVQISDLVAFGYAGALAVALIVVTLLLLGAVRIATRTRLSDSQSSIGGV